MLRLVPTEAWKQAYPDSHAGLLVMRGAANPARHAGLEERKAALEEDLRRRYAGQDRRALLSDPILHAYDAYYRRFKKTYHVQLQLESIVFKGKSIQSVAALVEAMFMAEMSGFLLTAGHEADTLRPPLALDIAAGTESYTVLRGDTQVLKPEDMFIRDAEGVVSDILYGPDQRTQITAATRNAAFTIYAPSGIPPQAVQAQLEQIRANILLIAPEAQTETLEVIGAD
jgi:DNA/RNA-binding domain of Phe-tRNA-synthetase-like protein